MNKKIHKQWWNTLTPKEASILVIKYFGTELHMADVNNHYVKFIWKEETD